MRLFFSLFSAQYFSPDDTWSGQIKCTSFYLLLKILWLLVVLLVESKPHHWLQGFFFVSSRCCEICSSQLLLILCRCHFICEWTETLTCYNKCTDIKLICLDVCITENEYHLTNQIEEFLIQCVFMMMIDEPVELLIVDSWSPACWTFLSGDCVY